MSIQTEIERIIDAKQSLSDWLLNHDVQVSFDAKLGELVSLLDDVHTGGTLAPVEVTHSSGIVLKSIVTPPGSEGEPEELEDGNRYMVPANSLVVVYAIATSGGTASRTVSVGANASGDVSFESVYRISSTDLATKPILIGAIRVGENGGAVNFVKKASGGSVVI